MNEVTEEEMLKIVGDYRERQNNNKNPTYEEMLNMAEKSLQTWLLLRIQKPERDNLLKEMVKHEEITGSYRKQMRENEPPQNKLVFDFFTKKAHEEIRKLFEGVEKTATKYGYKEKDGSSGDIIRDSIFAKAFEDYFSIGLGSKK